MIDYEIVEQKINYKFKNKELLLTAFTHASYANIHRTTSYDRMEFLGDSIVSFVVAEYLYSHCARDEGDLSRIRSRLVDKTSLASLMMDWDVCDQVLTEGADTRQGKLPSDVFEAVVGAVYLDSGFDVAKKFVLAQLKDGLDGAITSKSPVDYKTQLQERVQAGLHSAQNPVSYTLIDDSQGRVQVEVAVGEQSLAIGCGSSKKEAEQDAARNALGKLKKK